MKITQHSFLVKLQQMIQLAMDRESQGYGMQYISINGGKAKPVRSLQKIYKRELEGLRKHPIRRSRMP